MRTLIGRTVVLSLAAMAAILAARPADAQLTRADLFRRTAPIFSTALPQNQLLWLINDTRTKNGLAPLTPVNEITQAASFLAGDMFKMGRASHTDSFGRDGGQRLSLSGYNATAWGEIIGESWSGTQAGLWAEQDMLNWWMNSPPHRANMLNPNFTEIGIGISTGQRDGMWRRYWCVNFGRR